MTPFLVCLSLPFPPIQSTSWALHVARWSLLPSSSSPTPSPHSLPSPFQPVAWAVVVSEADSFPLLQSTSSSMPQHCDGSPDLLAAHPLTRGLLQWMQRGGHVNHTSTNFTSGSTPTLFYVSLTVTTTWKWRGQEGVLTNIMWCMMMTECEGEWHHQHI